MPKRNRSCVSRAFFPRVHTYISRFPCFSCLGRTACILCSYSVMPGRAPLASPRQTSKRDGAPYPAVATAVIRNRAQPLLSYLCTTSLCLCTTVTVTTTRQPASPLCIYLCAVTRLYFTQCGLVERNCERDVSTIVTVVCTDTRPTRSLLAMASCHQAFVAAGSHARGSVADSFSTLTQLTRQPPTKNPLRSNILFGPSNLPRATPRLRIIIQYCHTRGLNAAS